MYASNEQVPIISLASPPGKGAVGVIRISGESVHQIFLKVCNLSDPLQYRHAYYKNLVWDGELIDDVIVVLYKGPHSYTGQDSVEIFCHGSMYVCRRIIEIFNKLGIRQALPGEFTQRAYFNGKIDLAQAEGVAALIAADSEHQQKAATQLTSGALSKYIFTLRQKLIEAMAVIEASIDFPDESETAVLSWRDVRVKLEFLLAQIQKLIDTYPDGQIAKYGLKVAIIGAPNSGKSTLLNKLLGYERAIVSDIPGTTRDFLEESCLLKGRLFRFVDTAGIRESVDPIENQGIIKSKQQAEAADLILYLVSSKGHNADLDKFKDFFKDDFQNKILKIKSKSDLSASIKFSSEWLPLSVFDADSIAQVVQMMCDKMDQRLDTCESDVVITTSRHMELLKTTHCTISKVVKDMGVQYDECIAFELQRASECLEEILGKVDNEMVLDHIFTQFCLGK